MTLDEAYEACRDIAREEARNFYYGFILLPPERRAGIYAAYAFSRRADDSVDDEGTRAGKLAAVADRRDELDACYGGTPPGDDPVLVALADTVRRFEVPRSHLDALLDGVAMDLTFRRYPDFPALKEYCDRVAGAVGLVSLHVFGFSDSRAPGHAADLGVAMQIVNIMRDVAEDAERDRIYLPADEMAAHGVSESDVMDGVASPGFRALMRAQGSARPRLLRPRRAAAAAARPPRPDVRVDALWPLPGDPGCHRGARLRRLRRAGVAVDAAQARPDGSPDRIRAAMSRPQVVVCGGGLAGIAAAVEAAGLGAEVTLVERRPFLGGKAFSFTDPETGREVDNGQHVYLGCCPAYIRLLRLLGTLGHTSLQRRLDAPVRDRAGRRGALRAAPLPAPLHLGLSFAAYPHLSAAEKASALRALGALAAMSEGARRELDGLSFADWLADRGQSPGAVRRFWDLIVLPTCNDRGDRVSAALAAFVFRRGFLQTSWGSGIGWSRVGLTRLVDPAARQFLAARGGRVVSGAAVAEVRPGAVALADGATLPADAVVLALPPGRASAVCPEALPADPALGASPIVNVHVWYDRPVMDEPFTAVVDSPVQWIFNRTVMGGGDGSSHHLAISISGAREEVGVPRAKLAAAMRAELEELLPRARAAEALATAVVKEPQATFAQAPGQAARRPGVATPLPGVALAGAWTATGWPATMEGAVRSGIAAARHVLGARVPTER